MPSDRAPLNEVADAVAVNLVTSWLEPQTITVGALSADDDKLLEAMWASLRVGGLGKNIGTSFSLAHIQKAFERLVEEGRSGETCVVAWSPPGDPFLYENVAVTRGDVRSVRAPFDALGKALSRRTVKLATVAVLHDHPANILTEVFKDVFGVPPGPSTQDRLVAAHLRTFSELNVSLHLWEARGWRNFTRSPDASLEAWLQRICRRRPAPAPPRR